MASLWAVNPEREAAIGARFREAREERDISQATVASAIEQTRDQVAHIEAGRTILRADVAYRFCSFLGLSQRWLATGVEPDFPFVLLPDELPMSTVFTPDGSFSQMYDLLLAPYCDAYFKGNLDAVRRYLKSVSFYARPVGQRGAGPSSAEAAVLWRAIRDLFSYLVTVLPPRLYGHLFREIHALCEPFIAGNAPEILEFQKGRDDQDIRRATQLIQSGADAAVRVKTEEASLSSVIAVNSLTSQSSESKNSPDMTISVSSWAELRDRLRALTVERGAKARLARTFGISTSAVSEWLREKSSPSSDLTIRLLPWVASEEARRRRETDSKTESRKPQPAKSPKSKSSKGKR